MCPHCKSKHSKIDKRHWPDGKFDYWCMACGNQVPEPEEIKALESVGGDLARYDRMVLAINECHQTDEVKDIRDQALALQHCAKIAKNIEAERKAAEIRIRAERRAGELLKEADRGQAGRPKNNSLHAQSNYQQAKEQAEISEDQAHRWQKLADVPEGEFEEKLSDPNAIPSTSGLIEKPPSILKNPVADIPQPTKLDNNPRRCTASCCPDGSDIAGPWNTHDAQSILDEKGFQYGHFGKDHDAVLDFGVECEQYHALAQFRGGLQRNEMVRDRLHGYRGVGQEKR